MASAQSDQSLRCPHEETLSLSYPLSAQQNLWSDWVDAQADLSLRWVHSHFVGFVMRRSFDIPLSELEKCTPLVITSTSCCRTSKNLNFANVKHQIHYSIWYFWWCSTSDSLKIFQALSTFLDKQVSANSVDSDQTAPAGAIWSGYTMFGMPSASFGRISLW